jgi:fructose transport system substrate-binding protein
MNIAKSNRIKRHRRLLAAGAVMCIAVTSACGSTAPDGDQKLGVTLITKDSTSPFFLTMQKGAKEDAEKAGVDLTLASGKTEGDDQGQISAIENAVARGDKGILITPMSTGVNAAIKKARDAGLYVIALDTPPDPVDTTDITFATDNRKAGRLIGEWTAAKLDGKPAVIALIDLFNDKIVSVDYDRGQGFLEGMGIDVNDPKKNGDEAPSGRYSGGKGGEYSIVCNEAGNGVEDGGRTAMEKCLSKNKDINVVYAINEPSAIGASAALKAAGNPALLVSIDGGCSGLKRVESGELSATAMQYPLRMASKGVEAIVKLAETGEKPSTSPGQDFFDTGETLVASTPAGDVKSLSPAEGLKTCWG